MRPSLASPPLLLLFVFIACAGAASPARSVTLRLATWDVYCDPGRPDKPLGWETFERETGAVLVATTFNTNDEILRAMRAGGFDICIVACDIVPTLIAEGLIGPLPVGRLANYRDLLPILRHARYGHVEGRDFCAPFSWGEMVLAYDTAVFSEPPRSWQVLWDPAWRGRVAHWDDISVLWTAALASGQNDAFTLEGEALWEAGRLAGQLRANGVLLWRDERTQLDAMVNGDIVLNATWPNAVAKANRAPGRRSGTWAVASPEEGATAFIDNVCLASDCADPALALRYLDLVIGPEVQSVMSERLDYSPVNQIAAERLGPQRRAQLHLEDPNYLNRAFVWRPNPNRAEYERIWREARAGRLMQ